MDDNNSTDPDIDPDAPVIFSTSPVNNESSIERNKIVEITFDQAMDPSTINTTTVTLQDGTTTINGSVDYSGTTATFTTENVLAAQTDYCI